MSGGETNGSTPRPRWPGMKPNIEDQERIRRGVVSGDWRDMPTPRLLTECPHVVVRNWVYLPQPPQTNDEAKAEATKCRGIRAGGWSRITPPLPLPCEASAARSACRIPSVPPSLSACVTDRALHSPGIASASRPSSASVTPLDRTTSSAGRPPSCSPPGRLEKISSSVRNWPAVAERIIDSDATPQQDEPACDRKCGQSARYAATASLPSSSAWPACESSGTTPGGGWRGNCHTAGQRCKICSGNWSGSPPTSGVRRTAGAAGACRGCMGCRDSRSSSLQGARDSRRGWSDHRKARAGSWSQSSLRPPPPQGA